MTLLRGAEIERFLANPGATRPIILLFGSDPGAVSERAISLTKQLVGDDALAVARFDESQLAAEPGRLADEAYGASLFAGLRVIRIRAGGNRSIAAELKAVLETPPTETWIIIEAGDLRKTAPLRKLCEASANAAAIGCYPDNDLALGRLIDAEVADAGLIMSSQARTTLIDLLGADRAASRSEIRKLCLYAQSTGAITPEDITAIIGDGSAVAIDDIVNAAALGDNGETDRGFRKLLSGGVAAATIGAAAERHLLQLHRLRAAFDNGGLGAAMHLMRPPPMQSRRAALERQIRLWPLDMLTDVLERFNQSMIDSRLHPGIASAIIARALAGTATRAANLAKRQSGP